VSFIDNLRWLEVFAQPLAYGAAPEFVPGARANKQS
jgi:hypothetical protein